MAATTLIVPFEVPAGADEAFISRWRRARDVLAERGGAGAATLHRALRPDVDFRFVGTAAVDSPEMWRAAAEDRAFAGADMPFAAHPGLYEVAIEDGDVDGEGGVLLINAFEVPPEADERFVSGWDAARGALAGKRGLLGSRLHRSVGGAAFRFVNIARWSSPLMFARAIEDPGFREAAAALAFASHPALYQVVRR